MDIVNGTSDDAKVKVSGGGSARGESGSSKGRRFRDVKARALWVRAGKTYRPRVLPTLPLTVYFLIPEQDGRRQQGKEVELSEEVKDTLDTLKLMKEGKNGYVVKPFRARRKA